MDSKSFLSPGKKYYLRASISRSFLESSSMCVDVIISPFGMRMGSGLVASCFLSHGDSRIRSCPFVAVSDTSSLSTVCKSLGLD